MFLGYRKNYAGAKSDLEFMRIIETFHLSKLRKSNEDTQGSEIWTLQSDFPDSRIIIVENCYRLEKSFKISSSKEKSKEE